MNSFLAALVLLLRFLRGVLVSGVQTVRIILDRHRPAPAFVRMRFAPMSESGAALLGCMISLTPGTTLVDIDLQRREMVLHVLDASNPEKLVGRIRRDFERYLVILFGEPS